MPAMPGAPVPIVSAFAAIGVVALACMGAPVQAGTCADRAVTARGDPSRFEVLAKAKARANWRAKVRAVPTLGAAYADFSRALAADYRCSQKDGRHVCVAVAHPCRS